MIRRLWGLGMERSTRSDGPFMVAFNDDEHGKISLLASLLMLALVALAGLIGNVGHAAKEKIEVQNAADSLSFSSSLWMARGMNAVTATNHMLGEATALAAIHEAFGGPELDLGVRKKTNENETLDNLIKKLSKMAPVIPSPYSPPPIPSLDRRVVTFVTNATSKGDGRMSAFATIYDSRMTLKRQLAIILPAKAFANLGFLVPPPWGFATAAIAYGVHIVSTANIVLIGKEWFVLEALEAISRAFKPVKSIVEKQLVPTLAAHAEFVSGFETKTGKAKPGILNSSVERVVLDLEGRLKVEASLFPKAEKLILPVVPEPRPSMNGTGQKLAAWGSDKPSTFPMPELNSGSMKRKLDRALRRMEKRVEKLEEDLSDLDQFEKDIDQRLSDDDVDADEKQKLEKERREIEESRIRKTERIEEIRDKLSEIRKQKQELEQIANQPLPTVSDNLSVKSVPQQLDQQQAQKTQWVRATYPQVDAFRAPIRAWLDKWTRKSKAAEHFDKWTNRYTMIKAWQYRSGYRPRIANERVSWSRQKDPLHMFVMKDSFRNRQSRKGRENWTGTDSASRRKAESLFTLVGVAHREYKPLFSRILYPSPAEDGMTAYAQSIFYNANRQDPGSESSTRQAKIGWDTLNWDPKVNIPQWGAEPHKTSAKWPWEAFDAQAQQAVAKVKLNWQAKLMPVRARRLQETAVTAEGSTRKNLEHAAKYFEKLGNH